MNTLKLFAAAGAIAASLASVASAETVLKFATAAPEKTPWASQIARLADAIAAETEGRVKVDIYYNSQLGGETETMAQVARGRIEMGLFTLTAAALQEPSLSIAQLPSFYDTDAQRACVLDNHLFEPMSELMKAKGVHLLQLGEVGHGYLFSNEPIKTVDDLKGKKVAMTPSKIGTELWKVWGANGVPTSPAEYASSASTGLVDVVTTVYTYAVPTGLTQITPVVTEMNYYNSPGIFVMSERSWNALSEEDQAGINRAAASLSADQNRQEINAFEDIMRGIVTKNGGTIYVPTPEERATFRDLLPPLWDAASKDYGENGEMLYEVVTKGKEACGS